jgi:putative oxidoreductase
MQQTNDFASVWTPRVQSLLRIVVAFVFIQHGMSKYFDFPSTGLAGTKMMSLLGVAGILELCGGALMFLGLFTRPAAFVLSGFMAVAYFIAHFPKAFSPLQNGGEAAVLYCFIYLFFAVAGGGSFSLDAARRK